MRPSIILWHPARRGHLHARTSKASVTAATRCSRSARPGCPDVTDQLAESGTCIQPLLVVRDAAAAIEFYTSVFGATEVWRLMHYHRIGHAVLRIGTSE